MSYTSTFMKSGSNGPRYTNLFAYISEEEEDSYTVRVRLFNQAKPESTAWGEEVANSLEMASMMVSALATEFSIAQAQIKIEKRMRDPKSGTRHWPFALQSPTSSRKAPCQIRRGENPRPGFRENCT